MISPLLTVVTGVKWVKRSLPLVCFLMLLSLWTADVQAQANPLRIRKTIVGNLSSVEVGQTFQYRITASCNNLTTNCGNLTLVDDLPTGLTLVGISGPLEPAPATSPGIKYIYEEDVPAVGQLTIRNKRGVEPGAGLFNDGEIVEFLITVRVDRNATPGTLNNDLQGDVTQRDTPGDPPPVVLPPVSVTLNPPDPPNPATDWTYDKVQVVPVPPQQPTTGQPTLYQMRVCPVNTIGILPYTGLVLTDTYPTGATLIDTDGGTPNPPNQVIWNIPDAEVLNALNTGSCITRELLVRYDSPPFSIPTLNLANDLGVDANECPTVCPGDTLTFDLVAPAVNVTTTKAQSGSPVGVGGVGRFFLSVNPNQGNVPAPNLELFDNINENQIRITEIQSGTWSVLDPLQPFVSVRATVRVTDDLGTAINFGPFNGTTNSIIPALPLPPRRVSEVRWIFEYDPDGPGAQPFTPGIPLGFQMGDLPEIVYTPLTNPPFPTAYTPGTYQNCADTIFTGGAGSSQNCINYILGDPGVTGTNIETAKLSPTGVTEFTPTQEFPLELRLRLSERAQAGDQIINPTIIDVLPPELEFVRWDAVTFVNVPGGPHPAPFLRVTGQTLQWYWQTAPLAGSVEPAPGGLPATVAASGSSAFTMTANGTDQDVIVRFTVRIAANVAPNPSPAAPYNNTAYFIGPDTPICENGTLTDEATAGIDDGDSVPEQVCSTNLEFRVRRALALEGFKWIRNENYAATPPRFPEFAIHTDNTVAYDTTNAAGDTCTNAINYFEFPTGSGDFWTRFPCVAFGFPESPLATLPPVGPFTPAAPNDDQFEYLLDVRNAGNVNGQDYYLYDILPRSGDTGSGGPLSESPRLSRFRTHITGPVTLASSSGLSGPAPIVEYNIDPAYNPCRPQVFDDPAQPGGCNNTWTTTLPADPRTVTSYRIRFPAGTLIAVGGRMLFRVPMVIAYDAVYGPSEIAWNSFAHTAVNEEAVAEGFLPPAEVRKVGIRVPERLSLGNRVWLDSDNSGTINPPDNAAPGIAGVTVNLYADFDGNGVPDGAAVASELTDANGFYLFDNLFPNDTGGNPFANNYIVGIPASNFATAGDALFNLRSSTGTPAAATYTAPPETNPDRADHGIDPVTPGQEVLSASINLVLYNELTNEADLSANPRDGAFSRGTRGEANNNSDLTVDFGFFEQTNFFSIGNHVWYDDGSDGAGGFTAGTRNNGIRDTGERPVAGARVNLYREGDTPANGPQADELIRFDVTDAGGFYLFDNLAAGTYYVQIDPGNFTDSFDPDAGGPLPAALGVLRGWYSSTPTDAGEVVDDNDNGVNTLTPATGGVFSGPVVLALGTPEVTGETFLSSDTGSAPGFNPTEDDGPLSRGRFGESDDRSNLTIDFGFIPPMSLGNRVWFDDSFDAAQWLPGGTRNNSLIDVTDDGNPNDAALTAPGITGVTVQLLFDADNSGTLTGAELTTPFRTTTTGANGYYLFDGIPQGNYIVRIPNTNFDAAGDPLFGLISSFDAAAQPSPTDQDDSDDNGIDNATPATNGIQSALIELRYLSESVADTDLAPAGTATTLPGPNSRGRNGEADNDSDLTLDFGFVRPPLSIGNQVWLDDHPVTQAFRNNGVINAGETLLPNVEVALYRDLNNNGIADGGEDTGLRDTTDGTGFYLFSNLPPGNYMVAVTAANFAAGGPLENTISSRSVAPNPLAADNQTDNNDNGRDPFIAGVGILSSTINLAYGAEPLSPAVEVAANINTAGSDGPNGRGTRGERDNDSDLTIDFGFYVVMSLGNRVWLDDTDNTANWTTTRNNALMNTAADDLDNPNIPGVQGLGVAGVTLRLYRDLNTNGVIDAGEDSGRTTTTDANGYYVFDGLPRGNYIVAVEASNFAAGAPLAGFVSSFNLTAPTDNNTDTTDDGTGSAADPMQPDPTFGVRSPSIVLSYTSPTAGAEPIEGVGANDETDPTPQVQANRGANGERDAFSNLTIDFGFVRPPRSLGNRLWLDNGTGGGIANNGILDGTEPAVPTGVTVSLYRDANGDGVPDGAAIRTDATDANGYYLFENLPPGQYVVGVDQANFAAGGLLEEYTSSVGNVDNAVSNLDNRDNGVDRVAPQDPVLSPNGILSTTINLTATPLVGLPTGEVGSGNVADGPQGRGNFGETDANSDLTIDFGFFKPMSLGNRVWLDNGAGGGIINNGLIDGGELGRANVRVELFLDDGDNTFDAGDTLVGFDVTDATGFYLFDRLVPGTYFVNIAAGNFTASFDPDGAGPLPAAVGALNGLSSSTPTGTETGAGTVVGNPSVIFDNDDNGLNTPSPATTGVQSGPIVLAVDSEPAGETSLSGQADPGAATRGANNPTGWDGPQSRGRNNESDDNSNLTVDFGFIPPMSLGNRVWLDSGVIAGPSTSLAQYNNGQQDGTEPGIDGVTVALDFDINGDGDYGDTFSGIPETAYRTTTTANGGYYLFDALQPGVYRTRIVAANFAAGGPLENLISSVDTNQTTPPAENDEDMDDNGVDDPSYLANGISSSNFTLTLNGELLTDDDVPTPAVPAAYGPLGFGRFGEEDDDSNLTLDFGFIAPPRSLGNRVWFDDNNSGTIDAGDRTTLAGVAVSLYLDADGNGVPDGAAIRTDITDADGYYLFDNLPQQQYIVGVDAANFAGGAVLEEYGSSVSTVNNAVSDVDSLDNGINQATPAAAPFGVISTTIDLRANPLNGPTTEADVSADTGAVLGNNPTADDGPQSRGRFGETNADSDLTIDFGFFKSLSLGNRVWLDNGAGANYNNGVRDAGEVGIAGVRVELYRDDVAGGGNGDGRPQPGEFIGFDVTDGGGYYLFDGLIPGTYLAFIPRDNFTNTGGADTVPTDPLANFNNSSPVGVTPAENAIDDDDVGINENFPEINGVVSVPFVLTRDNEPTGETDLSADTGAALGSNPTTDDGPLSRGRNNESDDSSNLTVDFGFVGPVFSIGNRVWADIDNSGTVTVGDDYNPTLAGDQPGIPGVTVALYRDNGNGVFNLVGDTLVSTDVTDANGFYLFSNLPPGDYFVWIDQTNFRVVAGVAQPLFDWYSSTLEAAGDSGAGTNTDNDDNGVNDLTPDVGGIVSSLFTLSKNDEPIGGVGANDESTTTPPALNAGLSGAAGDGPQSRGTSGELDSDSNLTVDFGFYRPMSLGNRVWFDADGDGLIDVGTETGIAGVRVELYRDTNGNSTFDPGTDTLVKFDVTDGTGYYLFDNLPPANYFVHLPASNFDVAGDPLFGRSSTLTTLTTDVDSNDNGIDNPNPAANGITSNLITLILSYNNSPNPQQQPLNEGDLSSDTAVTAGDNPTGGDGPNRRGRFGETDGNSDLTIDFGFIGAGMSLGNRVWFDGNNNGLIDTTGPTDDFVAGGAVAPGIPGVTVRLYRDANADGVPDSATPVVPDQVTNANGYYLFQNIQPGTYVVGLVNSNFNTGSPLNGLLSSTTSATEDTGVPGNPATPNTDSDDNGVDAINATFGLLSTPVVLTLNTEPPTEVDLGPTGNGTAGATPITAENSQLTIDFGLFRPMSLGNRLWFDTNNNSTQEAGESGVPAGVTVGLYRDDNSDDVPDGPSIATTTTDANGYYIFDGLGTGRYIVIVEEANFQPGGALVGYNSSPGEDTTSTTDRNDNGRNNPTPATGGVRSNVITLTPNTSPTSETDLGPDGNGTNGETNNNSNLTIDFGFSTTTQLSLGNLVWLDNGGTTGIARDGLRNGDEAPMIGVRVNLYRDVNADGIPDDLGAPGPTGDIVASDVTDAAGHYLFDNLAPGNYIVELAASNFNAGSVLDGYGSTTTAAAPDLNNQDYGIDTPNTVNGIRSSTITLTAGSEPTADTDTPAPAEGYGAGGVDANGNMTVDFGVYRPLSIGNRVWFDTDADGTIDATENGIAGVQVQLFVDTNNSGVFDTGDLPYDPDGAGALPPLTDTTDSRGYYLFGDLVPGSYFVYIPPSQFTGAGSLTGFNSTVDGTGTVDNNDNGLDNPDPVTNGIVSSIITLTENGAPINETDFSGDATADGPRFIGLDGENNRNSDISIDFGFTTTPMSLGNRVWLDNGTGGGISDNGLIDGAEVGIANVRVNLFADTNSDGVPDSTTPIRTDTTDATGYYLFDNLPPGNYVVQIAPSNFTGTGALRGLFSSTGATADPTLDINDNGIDNANPATNGILSATIALTPTTMPTGETDPNPQTQADRGANGELDENSNLTIDFGFSTRFDWGDAPDTYTTTSGTGGPSHVIVSSLYLGSIEDNETDGQPNATADGDDTNGTGGDDEDGVVIPTLVAGTTLNVEVTVFNNTGTPATLVGWVDLNGNGTFEPTEAATATVPSSASTQTVTLTFNVPSTADIDTGGSTYARFRLTTDPVVTTSTPGGAASDGEVEDYRVTVNPPGVSITKTDGLNSIVTGQSTTYTITIQYSGLTGITRVVNDTTTPANAFVPASLSWTCTANAFASCTTGLPLDTDITTPVPGLITGQTVDLQQGGQLVYTLTGTLRPDYNDAFPGVPDVVNTVALDSGETATDTNGVIFDPPFGVKTGRVLNANTIRWTMVWFNTGLPQAATITDVLEPNQTNPINLVCTPFGTSVTTLCEVQNGDTIFWEGTLGDGTTPANRQNNRLEIVFDVTVPGPGNYGNLAIYTPTNPLPGAGQPVTVTAAVNIPGPDATPDPNSSSGGTGTPSGLVPTLSKVVDPLFSHSGETVTWTILVVNPHNQALSNVTVSDNVPRELEILSTSVTNGNILVTEQTITVQIATLNALETVSLTVTTRIRANVNVSDIRNLAEVFTAEAGKVQAAEATVSLVTELPRTGEMPLVWLIGRGLVLALIAAGLSFAAVQGYKIRRARQG